MLTTTQQCDRCGTEITKKYDNIDEFISENEYSRGYGFLNIIGAGGKAGGVCMACYNEFQALSEKFKAERDKKYAEFWEIRIPDEGR